MAKTKESHSAYFRNVFQQNRTWLHERSNDKVIARWLTDHPGETEVPKTAKDAMSNVKSQLRKNTRKRKKADALEAANHAPAGTKAAAEPKVSKLEQLEIRIDDCFTLANFIDPVKLEHVIRLLRKARNEVVWMQGQ